MGEPGQGIRVISFDGSALDATGLSQLLILEDIAGRWTWDREGDEREGGDVQISEFCDIVGGTGLGGFYAILFSLGMTIAQVIESHKIIHTVLFSSEDWKRKNFEACGGVLNQALARIAEEVGLSTVLDAPFLSKNSFKCYVCVLNNLNAGQARALRNYRVRTSKSPRCSLREAIHATLADGVHLPPVWVQDEQFINASSGFANPSYEIMKELPCVSSPRTKLACFVNLGAGYPVMVSLTSGGSGEETTNLLRNANFVAQHLEALCSGLGPCYFRLSIYKGPGCSAHGSADGATQVVKSLTVAYLEETEISKHIDMAVESLVNRYGIVDVERLGSLAAEDGKAKLNSQIKAVHDNVIQMKKVIDNDIYRKIKDWLTPIDQTAKLDACIRARSSSTCLWLLDHPKVVEWKKAGGVLWCHAGMGTGKTIIASHIIETLINGSGECFIAYYYFEFTNPSTLSEEALFRSIISQLSHVNESVSRQLHAKHKNGALQPQLTTLHKVLLELVTAAPLPIYIIIDALDELPLPRRKYCLESLLQLFPLETHDAHVMVTSRDEVDILEMFWGEVSFDFSIEKGMVHHDITTFLDQQLASKKWQSWPKQDVENMRNILIKKADGMFRMIACQIEVLNQAQTTEDMHDALLSLPATLTETYHYILNTIPSHHRKRAHTLLCILTAVFQPISITELSILLAVELGDPTDAVNFPTYRDNLRYHEPQNLISLGSAFVCRTVVGCRDFHASGKSVTLQLSHASIKEYLLHDASHWCLVDDSLAHVTTARACLAALIHTEGTSQLQVTDLEYTLSFWWKHISTNASSQLLSQQGKLFESFPWARSSAGAKLRQRVRIPFGPRINLLSSPLVFAAGAGLEQRLQAILSYPSLLTVCDVNAALLSAACNGSDPKIFKALIEVGGEVNSFDEAGDPLLHYAVQSNNFQVTRTLVEHGADVNLIGGTYGSALEAASEQSNMSIVKFLVENGADFLVEKDADVNALGGTDGSALHVAALEGALNIVKFLVAKGAEVNISYGVHGSPLQAATISGIFDVVEFLVQSGADVNMQGGMDGSVLHAAAAKSESLDIVKFLVERGADVNAVHATSLGQWSVMDGAEFLPAFHSQPQEIIDFLIQKGAKRLNFREPVTKEHIEDIAKKRMEDKEFMSELDIYTTYP
ncbi:hypothetical protein DL96DRAFT_1825373 [Flagelloscypha sp. PMI_526]|nr:hypothetical protein DL96DRAFT_1825373 [Flagelloscypha sp. PMI_526]